MGVKALDDMARSLKSVAQDLENARVSEDIFRLKTVSTNTVVYNIQKVALDVEFLSENLKNRGFRDNSLWGRLKQAFAGLLGGW